MAKVLKMLSLSSATYTATKTCYTLRIKLRKVSPPVWREINVTGNTTFGELHCDIQSAMGWQNDHLHEFKVGSQRIGTESEAGIFIRQPVIDEDSCTLSSLRLQKGDKFSYWYDFGDDWWHDITVKEVSVNVADDDSRWSQLRGSGACPPEDCGGPYMYTAMVAALSDPNSQFHERALEWLGEDYDPKSWD